MRPLIAAMMVILLCQISAGLAEEKRSDYHRQFATEVEQEYGAEAWESKKALQAEITVTFGGKTSIDGTMTMKPDTSGVRIEQKNGTVLVWDGARAWVAGDTTMPRVRFNLLTWPYFLAIPFKLQDPGTKMQPAGTMQAGGKDYEVGKLTFEAGTGDAPDDWYLVYKNPENAQVEHLAYIVTYGKNSEEAAKAQPHAISYSDFQRVDGVLIPTTWKFVKWTKEEGPQGEVGSAQLSNLRFVTPAEDAFVQPANAKEDKLPAN